MSPEYNLAGYVDSLIFGPAAWTVPNNAEGLLGTLPAVATALLGGLAAELFLRADNNGARMRRLIAFGGAAFSIGLAWSLVLPLNKRLWTGSYAVVDISIQRWLLSPNAHLSNFWQVFGGTLYDAFAILAWSVMYVAIKHQQALILERERTLRAEALAHQSRLAALRRQLNPHFLFNALTPI